VVVLSLASQEDSAPEQVFETEELALQER